MSHTLGLIPAANQQAVNASCKATFDKVGGDHTVTVPLFAAGATDDSTPVFYWFCIADGAVKNAQDKAAVQQLQAMFAQAKLFALDLDKNPNAPADAIAGLGFRTALPLNFKDSKPNK